MHEGTSRRWHQEGVHHSYGMAPCIACVVVSSLSSPPLPSVSSSSASSQSRDRLGGFLKAMSGASPRLASPAGAAEGAQQASGGDRRHHDDDTRTQKRKKGGEEREGVGRMGQVESYTGVVELM